MKFTHNLCSEADLIFLKDRSKNKCLLWRGQITFIVEGGIVVTKKMKNFIGIVLFVAFSWFFVFTKAEVVEAYSWSKTLGNSPRVVQIDPENPNIGDIDPNAINIGLVGTDNTVSIYNTSGKLTKTIPMYPTSTVYHNDFMPNETARVSKAGIYKGRYVDLMFKNTGVYKRRYKHKFKRYSNLLSYQYLCSICKILDDEDS